MYGNLVFTLATVFARVALNAQRAHHPAGTTQINDGQPHDLAISASVASFAWLLALDPK